ncbi:MAG: cyclic nucleotide-binding domain-containing protein [Chloroflexi bacterium]|nr:cyclic nucleotide-binding domain-containing protein [Chloroflexota bacterium]
MNSEEGKGMERVIGLLKASPIFCKLTGEQLGLVADHMRPCSLAAGQVLFEANEPGRSMYLVDSGHVQVYLAGEDGQRIVLNEFRSGATFGEMALLDGRPRSASAVAVEPSRLYELDRQDFLALAARRPVILFNTLADISNKLRLSSENVQELASALALANHQLRELDRLKSSFIGVISHEMRTPLANLHFSLTLLARYGLDHLTADQQQALAEAGRSLEQARTMIDNLITFAAFVSKQGVLSLEEVAFNDVIEEALLALRPLAGNKGLSLETKLAPALPAVQADHRRLVEAVHHLVQNGIKFTPAPGRVIVKSWADDQTLYFEVEDTGVGVPAEKLATLWEGFNQLNDPLRRGVEGLGLGLTLVRYVANAHGGDVWAESVVGQGSRFGFKLPLS